MASGQPEGITLGKEIKDNNTTTGGISLGKPYIPGAQDIPGGKSDISLGKEITYDQSRITKVSDQDQESIDSKIGINTFINNARLPGNKAELNDLDQELYKAVRDREKAWEDFKTGYKEKTKDGQQPDDLTAWNDIKQSYDDKIGSLQSMRRDIMAGIDKIHNPETWQKVIDASDYSKDSTGKMSNDYLGVLKEVGLPIYNTIERATINDSFQKISKQQDAEARQDERHSIGLYSYNNLINNDLNVTPEEESNLKDFYKDFQKTHQYNGLESDDPKYSYINYRKEMNDSLRQYVNDRFKDPEERRQKLIDYSSAMNAIMMVNPNDGRLTMYGLKSFAEHEYNRINMYRAELDAIRRQMDSDMTNSTDGVDPIIKLSGTGADSKHNYENIIAYRKRIDEQADALNKTADILSGVLNMPEYRQGITSLATGKRKDPDVRAIMIETAKKMRDTLPVDKILGFLSGYNGQYEPSWTEAMVAGLYSNFNNGNLGQGTDKLRALKSIEWEDKNAVQEIVTGVKKGYVGAKSGAEKLIAELTPSLTLPTNPLSSIINPVDVLQVSQKMQDVALRDFEKRNSIYAEGTLATLGSFLPLVAGTLVSTLLAPVTGETSLALIPEMISNTVLGGMIADVVGNSLIEQEEYNRLNDIPDDPLKKWGIVLTQGVVMMAAGKIVGGTSKVLNKTVGQAVGSILRENPKLTVDLMGKFMTENRATWLKLVKNLGINTLREGAKGAGTMFLMTGINEYLNNIYLNEGDRAKFEKIVGDSFKSAKAGSYLGILIGPMVTGQSATLNYYRNLRRGIDVVMTKDGAVYERIGTDPENPNKIVVLDRNQRSQKIDINNIADGFSMTMKEKNQYLDAMKNARDVIPALEKQIRGNAVRRQVTNMVKEIIPSYDKNKDAANEDIHYYDAGDGRRYFITGKTKDGKIILKSFVPKGDGTYGVQQFTTDKVDPNKTITVKAGQFVDMAVSYYSGEGMPKTDQEPGKGPAGESEPGNGLGTPTEPGQPEGPKPTEPKPNEPKPNEPKPNEPSPEDLQADIARRYPDLVKHDLLPRDGKGNIIEPDLDNMLMTRASLYQDIAEISDQISDPTGQMDQKEIDGLSLQRDDLIEKLHVVEKTLDDMAERTGIIFNDKRPSQKFDILHEELSEGNEIKGSATMMTDVKMLVTLPDGRQFNAYIGSGPEMVRSAESKEGKPKKETAAQRKKRLRLISDNIMTKKEPVTLKLVRKEDWNPDDKVNKVEVNPHTGEMVTLPYGDRIDVQVGGETVGTVQLTDYNEKRKRDAQYKTAQELARQALGDIAYKAARKTGGIANLMEVDEKPLRKSLEDLVNSVATMAHIKASEAIAWVRKSIGESKYSEDERDYVESILVKHKSEIQTHVNAVQTARQLSEKFKVKEIEPFKFPDDEFSESENEGVATSAGQKTGMRLKQFNPLWKRIAEETGHTRNAVQLRFYQLVKNPTNNIDQVSNQDTYISWLNGEKDGTVLTDTMIGYLERLPYSQAISLFNFYRNVDITERIATIVNRNGSFNFPLLNSPENYMSFIKTFSRHLYALGPREVKNMLYTHKRLIDERFKAYRTMSMEDKVKAKKEQFEDDLVFLENLTGVDRERWRGYYTEQTRETFSFDRPFPERTKESKVNFGTYEKLLESETYRPGGPNANTPWIWFQGDLVFMLLNKKEYSFAGKTDREVFDIVKKYFTEGDDQHNVMSNLFKMSTAQRDETSISLDGRNVKGDRFSSFIQASDIQYTADHILESNLADNNLVKYYKSLGQPMKFVYLDGLHNRKVSSSRKGNTANEMSDEDIWVSLLLQYASSETDSYLNITGQYADKDNLIMTEVPKYENNPENKKTAIDLLGGEDQFDSIVNEIKMKVIAFNQPLFSAYMTDQQGGPFAGYNNLIEGFIINHTLNTKDISELLFGNINDTNYPGGYTMLVKRAATSSTTGYRLDENVEGGVGHSVNTVLVNDIPMPGFGIKEGMDGMILMSGKMADKTSVSMGDIFNKKAQFGRLSSIKASISYKDDNNDRQLVKPNIINIDILAENLGGVYADLKKFMDKHGIDILTVPAASKIHTGIEPFRLFDDNGKVIAEPGTPVITVVPTRAIIVQQDLRHDTMPKKASEPSQFLTNILVLPTAGHIINNMSRLQHIGLQNLARTLRESDESKLNFLKRNVNDFTQADLHSLLSLGITIDDPAYRNLMRTIMSSEIGKKALDIAINRVTTQEIDDLNQECRPLRKDEQGRTLLPEIITGMEGLREHKIFDGTIEQAIAYVIMHAEEYQDLLDYLWEIRKEPEGVIIPGEIIPSVRVPYDATHSLTLGRVKKVIPDANFTILDKESQKGAGSDTDGDSRFNQALFKDDKGKPILDDSAKGIMNEIVMYVAKGYYNPDMFDTITRPMDTNAYDGIVDRLREGKPDFTNFYDIRSFFQARRRNMVGNVGKGIMTDHMTTYLLINRYRLPIKVSLRLAFNSHQGTEIIHVSRIARDRFGAMQAHLSNILNMFFDNAKDPKVEIMGMNEQTMNMVILALIGDYTNSSDHFNSFNEHYDHILKRIDILSDYFTSPVVQRFVELQRRKSGGMRNESNTEIRNKMLAEAESFKEMEYYEETEPEGLFTESQVKDLFTLYYAAAELTDMRTLYRLTQNAPLTYAKYIHAKHILRKVSTRISQQEAARRNIPFHGMTYIDTRPLFIENKDDPRGYSFVPELAIAENVIDFAEKHVFNDMIEESAPGKRIITYLFRMMRLSNKNLSELREADLNVISNAMNRIFDIKALGIRKTFPQVKKELFSRFAEINASYPDNTFLDFIRFTNTPGKADDKIQILPEFAQTGVPFDMIDSVRNDFDKLPAEIKDLFASYVFYQYGANNSTTNGGFFSLFGNNYRVEISKLMTEEKNRWLRDGLTPMEQLNIATWMRRTIGNEQMRQQDPMVSISPVTDYFSDPLIKEPVHIDALDQLANITDLEDRAPIDQYREILSSYELPNLESWYKNLVTLPAGSQMTVMNLVVPAVKKFLEQKSIIARQHFATPSDEDNAVVRDMHEGDRNMELMLVDDPAVNTLVTDYFKKMYPGLEVFGDHDAFVNFVRKNSRRMLDVSMNAIGHAFKNAIYVDPDSPVQEIAFHEMSHIYWDHLPANHSVKAKLRDLYREDYPDDLYDLDDLDEMIIRDIGSAGYQQSADYINPTKWQRFLNYLKDFWRTVKEFFGKYSKKDLIDDMVRDIYHNSDNIKFDTENGAAAIRNLVKYENSEIDAIENREHYLVKIGGERLYSVTRAIGALSPFKFNPIDRLNDSIDKFSFDYYKQHGVYPTPEIKEKEIEGIKIKWSESSLQGSNIHAVAEYVFGNKGNPPENIINRFASKKVYDEFKQSLELLKAKILHKYPGTIFYTEETLISAKYKMFGYGDLVADIGDNRLIVFDFKTTDYEYQTSDGKLSKKYTTNYGMMKFPITNVKQSKLTEHTLQLSMEAAILEEQKNKLNPNEHNTIEGLYVIPIIREVNENGLLTKARVSNIIEEEGTELSDPFKNCVPIKYEKDLAHKILNAFSKRQENIESLFPDLEEKLKNIGVMNVIRNDIKTAISYITSVANIPLENIPKNISDLTKGITYEVMMDIANNGDRSRYARMIDLDYDENDINSYSSEVYLNLTKYEGINKNRWLKEMDSLYPELETGEKEVLVRNENIPPEMQNQHYYHINIDGRDIYSHDIGTKNLKTGDKIVDIIIHKGAVHTHKDYVIYTVNSINSGTKKVVATNDKTGEQKSFYPVEAEEGLLAYDENPHIPQRNTTPNNFVQRYKMVQEKTMERHWKYDLDMTPQRSELQKKVWAFYNKFPDRKALIELSSDYEQMVEWYNDLSLDPISEPILNYLREMILNHDFAKQIITETSFGNTAMPLTLNIFYMLTNPNKMSIDLHGWWRHASWWQPPSLMSAEYTWLNFGTMRLQAVAKEAQEVKDRIREWSERLLDETKVPMDPMNMTTTTRGRTYYRFPGSRGLNKTENEFLRMIYEISYQYFRPYKYAKNRTAEKPFPIPIRVDDVFMTKPEFQDNPTFGKKWGKVVYDLMKPSVYDDTYINLADKIDGRYISNDRLVKWKDVKREFADVVNGNTELPDGMTMNQYMKQWFGSSYLRSRARNIPWLRKASHNDKLLVPGLMYHYYNEARKNYQKKAFMGHELNVSNKRIPSIGTSQRDFVTRYRLEATAKALQEKVGAEMMKAVVPIIDYVRKMYLQGSNADNYINDFANINVYKQSKGLDSELSLLADLIRTATSRAKIMYAVKTAGYNFAAGQYMNVAYEPQALGRGVKRFATNPRKFLNIMKHQNVANITTEARFDELRKAIGPSFKGKSGLVSWDTFVRVGYLPTEITEKFNQWVIFVGSIYDSEWDAYNDEGNIIDPSKNMHMSRERILYLNNLVERLQGHYTFLNGAPSWFTPGGSLAFQFRKYLPTMIALMFAPYHFNRYFFVESGVVPALSLLAKVAVYNKQSDAKRFERYKNAISRVRLDTKKVRELGDANLLDEIKDRSKLESEQQAFVINSTYDYLNMLIADRKGGKIRFDKDLSHNDREKLISFLFQFIFLTGSIAIMANRISGGKEEKKFKHATEDKLARFLLRYNQNMFPYGDPNQYKQLLKAPFPAYDNLANMIKFVVDFYKFIMEFFPNTIKNWREEGFNYALNHWNDLDKSVYKTNPLENPGQYVPKGSPKFVRDMLGFVTAGSGVKGILDFKNRIDDNQNAVRYYRRAGYDENIVQSIENMVGPDATMKDVRQKAEEVQAWMAARIKSQTWNAIQDVKYQIKDISKYQDMLMKQMEEAGQLTIWQQMEDMKNNNPDEFQQIFDDAAKYDKYKSEGKAMNPRQINRAKNEAIKKLNERNNRNEGAVKTLIENK